ncbi:MAG: hypothetical protein ACFFDB_18725 [Promethearchaeota archaeon]
MSKEKFVRSKPHVNVGTIAVVIITGLSAVSLGVTIYLDIMKVHDSDGDSIPDLEEGNAGHPLFFDASDDTLFFRTYETGTSSHEVGHNLGLSHDGFSSHVNVQLGLDDDVSTPTTLLDFHIKYDSLIEFIDTDTDGFFNPAVDTVIGKTTLNNMLRLGFGLGVDGEPAYYSSFSTIDGVFKVDFYTSREHVLLARQIGLLSPFELKSFITITGYTLITGTSLALNLSLSSSHNIDFSGTTLTAIASTDNYQITYEWYKSAVINDVNTTVNATVPSSPIPMNSGDIYINFGDVINATYDPKLYWRIPRSTNFNIADLPWSYITIGLIGFVAIGMASKIPRGKKKETKRPPPSKFDSIATEMQTTSGFSSEESEQGYVTSSAISTETTDHVPRKKPGRVKYSVESTEPIQTTEKTNRPLVILTSSKPSSKEASEKTTGPEKRIPETLTHRERLSDQPDETVSQSKKKEKKKGRGERYYQDILSDSDF